MEIQKDQYNTEMERLNAEEVVQQEIDKKKIEIAAEAEAEGLQKVLESKAAGAGVAIRGAA
jgi:flotillin